MDDIRRAELYARREALLAEKRKDAFTRSRAELVAMIPILSALEEAGEAYHSDSYRSLSDRLNHWADDPHRHAMREDRHAALPLDRTLCSSVIVATLREHLGADDSVTVIVRREGLVLTLGMPALIQHLDVLIANGEGDLIAFAAPPADWIVTVERCFAVPINEIVSGRLVDF